MATVYVNMSLSVKPGVSTPVMWFNRVGDPYTLEVGSVASSHKAKQSVANTDSYTVSGTPKFLVALSDQAVSVGWKGSTEANNGTAVMVSGVPFIIPTEQTLTHAAATALVGEAAVDIESVVFYNGSGSTAVIEVVAFLEAA